MREIPIVNGPAMGKSLKTAAVSSISGIIANDRLAYFEIVLPGVDLSIAAIDGTQWQMADGGEHIIFAHSDWPPTLLDLRARTIHPCDLAPTCLGVVIRKRGYFYRPDWAGYTANLSEAGHYDRAVAMRHAETTEGVTVHDISDFNLT